MKRSLILTALLMSVLGANVIAWAQQKQKPKAGDAKTGKHYSLPATSETTQWGWLDPKEPPKVTIDSGDIVSVETMMHVAAYRTRPDIRAVIQ